MKNKQESLLKEINLSNERIRHLKSNSKERALETSELIRLIIELDNLHVDEDIEE